MQVELNSGNTVQADVALAAWVERELRSKGANKPLDNTERYDRQRGQTSTEVVDPA